MALLKRRIRTHSPIEIAPLPRSSFPLTILAPRTEYRVVCPDNQFQTRAQPYLRLCEWEN